MYQNTSKDVIYKHAKDNLARNLKAVRKKERISQEELALRIGADQAYISRLESGMLNPTLESLSEIAHELNKNISDLFRE